MENYLRGMSIYAMNEDKVEPRHNLDQVIMKNKNYFDDLRFTMKPRPNFKEKRSQKYEDKILSE